MQSESPPPTHTLISVAQQLTHQNLRQVENHFLAYVGFLVVEEQHEVFPTSSK